MYMNVKSSIKKKMVITASVRKYGLQRFSIASDFFPLHEGKMRLHNSILMLK